MGNRRNRQDDLEKTKRISPYQEMNEPEYADADDGAYDAYDDDAYDGAFDDNEAMDQAAYDDEMDDEEVGFFSTLIGKIAVGIVLLLLVVVIALLVIRFVSTPKDEKEPSLPSAKVTTAVQVATAAPGAIVFGPKDEATKNPSVQTVTAAPKATRAPAAASAGTVQQRPASTPVPTRAPESTPLPIILTNTPTPSPTATPTPTPSPSPTPSPTPTPVATEVPDLADAEVNRKANLREKANSSAKVKTTLEKGDMVVIHEAVLDKSGKVWYNVTTEDGSANGWMRDYVVDPLTDVAKPTYTPRPESTPDAAEKPEDEAKEEAKEEATAEPKEGVIGTGKTIKEANLRKIMNGSVITQVMKNRKVEILSVREDKKGEIWYEVRVVGSGKVGFMRDYLIKPDEGVKLPGKAETADAAEEKAAPKPTPEPTPKVELENLAVIGRAATNRAANIRKTPVNGGKLVKQVKENTSILILDKYIGKDSKVWYEVITADGAVQGFMRDYLLDIEEIDEKHPAKEYKE